MPPSSRDRPRSRGRPPAGPPRRSPPRPAAEDERRGTRLDALPPLPGLVPRLAATLALAHVESDRAYAAKALEDGWREAGGSERDDRALATELVLGTWRWRGIVDGHLAPLLPRGLESLDDVTRQTLRVAAYELLGPRPTPAHAAVHLAVETAKRLRNRSLAGLVNAVLHRLARAAAEDAAGGSWTNNEERRTRNASLALPSWLHARLAATWGEADTLALARWSLERPGRTLRVNRRRDGAAQTASAFPGAIASPHTPWALRLAAGAGDLRTHPVVAAGRVTVQEEGAFLAAESLPVGPGAIVLDACAGRGTKTTALAERLPGDATLLAADVNPDKLARLAPELERLGLPPVEIVAVDWSVGLAGIAGSFDAILVDAPCTGTGTLSRRPEIRWRLEPADVARLVELQSAVLARTASLLAPGGALLYVVCSLLPEEGPDRVQALLRSRSDLSPVPDALPSPPWRRLDAGAVLLPHESGTDGFYAALLRRHS
jgi:16S rRNA (cytosine967-C5)-methyltransferase